MTNAGAVERPRHIRGRRSLHGTLARCVYARPVSRHATVVALAAIALTSGVLSAKASGGRDDAPLRGTLRATADTLGRVTLRRAGKPVSSVRAGRYSIVVVDTAARSGFIFDRPDFTQIIVTSSAFVGTRTVTVTLTPGSWSYQGAVGALHDFTVVA